MVLSGVQRYIAGSAIGFTAGFTLGCCGWGGAQIIKPSLTSGVMKLSQLSASGVSLTSLSGGATVGAGRFYLDDQVDLKTAMTIALPSLVGVRVGIRIAQKMSSELQALIFNGMSVILIPSYFFIQQRALKNPPSLMKNTNDEKDVFFYVKNAAFGGFLGTLTSIMGVGGVPMAMSYLTLTSDCPHHLIQGTAMATCLPPVLVSAFTLGFTGHTPLMLATSVAGGSMIGSFAGAQFALTLTDSQLRLVYMTSLVVLGGRSLVASIGNVSRLIKMKKP